MKNPSRFADVARAHVEEHARQGTLASSKEAKAKWAPAEGPPTPAAAIAGDRAGVRRPPVFATSFSSCSRVMSPASFGGPNSSVVFRQADVLLTV